MEFLIKLGFFLLLVAIGYWRGRRNERSHLKWLEAEEVRLAHVMTFATRYPPPSAVPLDPILVSGSVVLASDYFRLFLGGLRKIVGGNYRAYETLTERARREALVRLKAAALSQGAAAVFNVRYTTSRISDSRKNEATQVEVLAYGTAFVRAAATVAESRVHHRKSGPLSNTEVFDLMKNRVSRFWVISGFVLVLYSLFELFADNWLSQSWRYVNGAPWPVFWSISTLLVIGVFWHAGQKKVRIVERIVLALLSVPALTFALYFFALRVNGWTAPEAIPARYVLQNDLRLKPDDRRQPELYFEDYIDYWTTRKPGEVYELSVVHGWLGFYQYDIQLLRDEYADFYQRQGHE